MRYLLFFYAATNGQAAKDYAAPLRHRRHNVFLRDIPAALQSPLVEACDGIVVMLSEGETAPTSIIESYAGAGIGARSICPGDPIWDPSEDEIAAMNPLNKLRHDAALLGIEVNPAYDEQALVVLINDAKAKQDALDAAEEAKADEIAAAAEKARLAREGGGETGDDKAPVEPTADELEAAAAAAAAAAEAARLEQEAKDAEAAAADPLAGIDLNDAVALRAFAVERKIPVSPNKATGAPKLLVAIKAALGVK